MVVYKFGGASVRSAEGVENLGKIVSGAVNGGVLVVVSAMGKTTNALEDVLAAFVEGRKDDALAALDVSEKYHRGICEGLFRGGGNAGDGSGAVSMSGSGNGNGSGPAGSVGLDIAQDKDIITKHPDEDERTSGQQPGKNPATDIKVVNEPNTAGEMPCGAQALFNELRQVIADGAPEEACYDYWYDRIVSYGELISTTIIAEYFNSMGLKARWLDIRKYFITDGRHRDANIDLEVSGKLLKGIVAEVFGQHTEESRKSGYKVIVTQGFIGAAADGTTTTLGREGSDYSAAVAANILDADSLTIWKDVEGILNADPKFFSGTSLIPEMNYLDAIELAYSGAQIIHPKTIKPLKSKNIPLYVRPFLDPDRPGSRISAKEQEKSGVPVLILKKKQVLISVRPHDFSFVLEDKLPEIFDLMRVHNIRMNLIQSSAVNLSLCVDECRQLEGFGEALRGQDFRVVYNEGMELLTIRGYDDETFRRHTSTDGVYLVQKTRRIVRIVRRETPRDVCMDI